MYWMGWGLRPLHSFVKPVTHGNMLTAGRNLKQLRTAGCSRGGLDWQLLVDRHLPADGWVSLWIAFGRDRRGLGAPACDDGYNYDGNSSQHS
jgi:hypothetical protein